MEKHAGLDFYNSQSKCYKLLKKKHEVAIYFLEGYLVSRIETIILFFERKEK